MEVEREKKFLISKLKSLKLLLSASNESFANWSLLNWSFKRIVFFVGGGVNLIKWVIFIVGSEFCILLIIKKFKNDRWKSHDFPQDVSSFFYICNSHTCEMMMPKKALKIEKSHAIN